MGSLGCHDDAAPRLVTRLPVFSNAVRTSNTRSYHSATAAATRTVPGQQTLLERYALFILAVAEVDGSEIEFVLEADHNQTLLHASQTSRESAQVSRASFDPTTLAKSDLHFGISVFDSSDAGTDNSLIKLLCPLVLLVRLSAVEQVADVTLCLRDDYGPKAAVHHLLQLATAYLAPEVNLNNLEMSNLATPFPLHETSQNGQSRSPALLHTILAESARCYPHNIAVDEVTGGHALSYTRRELTYRELDAKVSDWADQIEIVLQRLDWPALQSAQRMVPIFLPNSTELLICMNAISKAGHCFCVLQMDAPEERLRDMLDDLCAPGILGIGSNPWAGTRFGEEIIWIDYLNPMACLEGRSSLLDSPMPTRRTSSEDDLAYIIYTSGSTGKPKGVQTTHRAAIALIRSYDAGPGRLPTGPRVRWMVMSTPTFDIVLMDNFMPLYKGGTVCLAGRDLILTNPEAVINELRATATFVVTSLAMLLRPQNMPTLSSLLVGGELIAQRVIDNFVPRPSGEHSARRLITIYGPTEATVTVSVQVCEHNSRPSVVGAPLPGTQYVILDMNSPEPRAVPLGMAGELAIISPQLSPGYLSRPKETAQAFIPDSSFGRLYRTGDRVRVVWSETGEPQIDFLGRTNFGQVKLNGRRVEVPEIENVLSKARGAAQVGVFIVKSKLLACVMPWDFAQDADTVESQCRAEAARYLPTWMQPLHYLVMEQFPRTTSGKMNRRALEEVIANQPETKTMSNGRAGTVVINGTAPKEAKPIGSAANNINNHQPPPKETVSSKSTIKKRLNENHAIPKDTTAVVYDGLIASLGERTGLDSSTSLANIGLDSLRALVFLQKMREMGIQNLGIHQVLLVSTIGELIETVEQQRVREGEAATTTSVDKEPDISEGTIRSNGKISTGVPASMGHTDGIDVSVIAADDEDAVHELPLEAKLRHYDYHCRPTCLKALGLSNHQVEQVLPVTNVQARFIAMAVSPDAYDPKRYVGRPHVEHFPYNVPSNMDPARLQRAVDAVLPRYDCFRTVFVPIAHPIAPFAQCILAPSVRKIPKVEIICDDTDAASSSSLWRETTHGAQRVAETAMSIDRPGIVATWVWSQNRARCVFILSLFHGIYDGTQLTYLRDAIVAEYDRPGCKPPVDLLPVRTAVNLTLSYDWVQTVMYWAGRLVGVPGFRLGSRRPSPAADLSGSYTGVEETHMRILSVKASMTMRELDHAAISMSTTLLTVAEAAWASVLAQTLGDAARADVAAGKQLLDVQFGTVMGGRRHQDALRCMAPMLAALPMRLVVDGAAPRTNRETCAFLAAQRREAQPYLQIPCPTMAHAQMGANRIDTVLLVQALQPEGGAAADTLRDLPGYNFEENLMPPYKEIDVGYPVVAELWPGRQRWGEKMLLRCMYNARRPGYEFLTRDWILGLLSALNEAMVRITSEPDAPFYTG